jgi:hypothetical protein
MSGDETFVMIFGVVVALFTWPRWYRQLLGATRFSAPDSGRALVAWVPLICAAVLTYVLFTMASSDVVGAYIWMYLLVGAGWLGLCAQALPWIGLSAVDDVGERGNGAAAWAVSGALLAMMFCFAGGNVGDGPGWWVVIFAAALATAGLALSWLLLDAIARVVDAITIERDVAAGLRCGAFIAAAGLVLGRAAAGDWVSAGATVRDFAAIAWPVLPATIGAAIVERMLRASTSQPEPSPVAVGAIPALGYCAAAVVYVMRLGMPA